MTASIFATLDQSAYAVYAVPMLLDGFLAGELYAQTNDILAEPLDADETLSGELSTWSNDIFAEPFDLAPILLNPNYFPGFSGTAMVDAEACMFGEMSLGNVFLEVQPFNLEASLLQNNGFPGFPASSIFEPEPSLHGAFAISVLFNAVPFDADMSLFSSMMVIEPNLICMPLELVAWMAAGEFGNWKALTPIVTYRCILTGAADGLPAVEIPISSFQIRKKVV